jgi:hypothetical protein
MSTDEVEQKDQGGRPKEGIKFGQHKNAFGWDPTGKKELDQAFNPENQKTTFTPDKRFDKAVRPVATENHNILRYLNKNNSKGPNIITETLKNKKKDLDRGTILDEGNIL